MNTRTKINSKLSKNILSLSMLLGFKTTERRKIEETIRSIRQNHTSTLKTNWKLLASIDGTILTLASFSFL